MAALFQSRVDENGRECLTCGTYKSWNEFNLTKSGHTAQCKICLSTLRNPKTEFRVDDEGRECTRCKTYQPWLSFRLNKGRFETKCKSCTGERSQHSRLRINYDVSIEWYEDKLKRQNGVCSICKRVCATGKALAVDHDHKTGKIRDLLCSKCNIGLGCFNDDTTLLAEAASYRRKHDA